jgi:hypothetical protein
VIIVNVSIYSKNLLLFEKKPSIFSVHKIVPQPQAFLRPRQQNAEPNGENFKNALASASRRTIGASPIPEQCGFHAEPRSPKGDFSPCQ